MHPHSTRHLSTERFELYQSLGFEIVHDHIVNINPKGERIEVDFSTTAAECIVPVAIAKAFEAGHQAGQAHLQNKVRDMLGLTPTL